MAESINGWEVLGSPPWDDPRLTRLKIPGTPCVAYMRASVAPLFVALALDYHKMIHPLVNRDDVDAYDYRQARAANAWSDHSSGTAIDIRASFEGAQGTSTYSWWKGAHAAAARAIKAKYEIVIWGGPADLGGDYGNPQYYDAMHWALKPGTSQADVNRMIRKLSIRSDGTSGTPTPTPTPVPVGKGPAWCYDFLKSQGLTGATHRIAWTIAGRESGWDPSVIYPAGKQDPTVKQPPSDWGLFQCNTTSMEELKATFGPTADMRVLLDPVNATKMAKVVSSGWTDWRAWGIGGVNADGSVKWDWSWYPATWLNKPMPDGRTQRQVSEEGFLSVWKQYPGQTPTPTPNPSPAGSVSLSGLLKGNPADVKVVQQALNRIHTNRLTVDGVWGPRTQAAYDQFRIKDLGLSGPAAAGLPGLQSLTELGRRCGFTVTR